MAMDGATGDLANGGIGSETPEARRARLAWESDRIDEADASARAGRTISFEAVSAWMDSWGTSAELPVPQVGD